jgi:hypothetical protein
MSTCQLGAARPRRGARGIVLMSAVAVLAFGLAACSTSPTDSTPKASSSATASNPNLSEAAAANATLTARPTSIGITVPVGAPIPAGKKIYFVVPNVPSALAMQAPLKAAAAELKWTTVDINAGASPGTFVAAVNTAIQAKPDGVFIAGIPPAVIQVQLKQLNKMNIPVITLGAPLGNIPPASDGILFNIAGVPYNTGRHRAGELGNGRQWRQGQRRRDRHSDIPRTARAEYRLPAADGYCVPRLQGLHGELRRFCYGHDAADEPHRVPADASRRALRGR